MRVWATQNSYNQITAMFFLTEIVGCRDCFYKSIGEFLVVNCREIAELPAQQQLFAVQLAQIAFGKARDTRKPARWLKRYGEFYREHMLRKHL